MHAACTAILSCLLLATVHAATPGFADFDRRARAGEPLNVVFFGASLTWGANATDPQQSSYRARIAQRLKQRYPRTRIDCWDAAIGGTGSQLGVFRFERDVLRHKPDLVFLDFTANDGVSSANPETLASYECLLRRIVLDAQAPVVPVLFPFMWDVQKGSTAGMLRRDAHLALAAAYNAPVGDAIVLAQERVKSGAVKLETLWPLDGVHPGNAGYELFADAAWHAFETAVSEQRVCKAPEAMLHAATYMTSARFHLAGLSALPKGWRAGAPHLTSAHFDMLMSRWLDDLAIGSNRQTVTGTEGKKNKAPVEVERLRVAFNGSMVLFFGESTPLSGKYRVFIDGKQVEKPSNDPKKQPQREFDSGRLGVLMKANAHFVEVVAEGLDASVEHVLEIEPLFDPAIEQEIRIESICVAGGHAAVRPMDSK